VEKQSSRSEGGRRNGQASLLVAANERANSTEQNDFERQRRKKLVKGCSASLNKRNKSKGGVN